VAHAHLVDDVPVLHDIESDHFGTPRVIVDAARNVGIWRWNQTNDPFGESTPNQNPGGDATSFTFNLRFAGQYRDSESGWYYNVNRYFDPSTGRYIESDPIGLGGGISTYSYVGAAPLTAVDPLGLEGVGPWHDPQLLRGRGERGGQFLMGIADFAVQFYRQISATHIVGREHDGWAHQDKYFHCMANCQAARRGNEGIDAAQCMSKTREWWDQFRGDPISDSEADMAANLIGRMGGAENPGQACKITCSPYWPGGSFPNAW
jgi:RHS repeat-associated protein